MRRNLGETRLPRKRRSGDPMAAYDRLPAPLRSWLSEAKLPWSPASAKRLWQKCAASGLTEEEALDALSRAEAATLARESLNGGKMGRSREVARRREGSA